MFSKRTKPGSRPQANPVRSAPSSGSATPSHRPLDAQRVNAELIERLTTLQAQETSREQVAKEALPAFLGSLGAVAGALLLYRPEEEALTLAAEQGLSVSGRKQIETIRTGRRGGWGIPLHGLLNHKAYIIERPREHRLIPELVETEAFQAVANIASIPLYRGQLPVGVLVAIAGRQAISETEVMARVHALDALAVALDPATGSPDEESTAEVALTDDAASLAREQWVDPTEKVRQLESDLATFVEERQELVARIEELEACQAESERIIETLRAEATEPGVADRGGVESRLREERAAVEATLEELRAKLGEQETMLVDRDRELEQVGAQLAERERAFVEHERALAELVRERDDARRSESEAAQTISALRSSVAQSNTEIERERGVHAEAIERQLARHREEIERLRATNQREAEAARSASERAILGHDRTVAELTEELDCARAAASETARAIAALRGEIERANAERARERAAHVQAIDSQLEDHRQEIERLKATHQCETETVHAGHQQALAALRTTFEQEIERLRAGLESARAGARDGEDTVGRLQVEVERTRAEVESTRAEYAEAAGWATAGARRVEALVEELAAARNEVAGLRADRERVLEAVEDPSAEPAAVVSALRAQVAALEGQVAGFAAERTLLERRAEAAAESAASASERQAAAAHHRQIAALLADHEREAERVHAEHQRELEALRLEQQRAIECLQVGRDAACAATQEDKETISRLQRGVERLQAALEASRAAQSEAASRAIAAENQLAAERAAAATTLEAIQTGRDDLQSKLAEEQSAASAEIERVRAALADRNAALTERDRAFARNESELGRATEALDEAKETIRRLQSEVERYRNEFATVRAAQVEAAERTSAAESRVGTLETELEAARSEVAALHEKHERAGAEKAERVLVLERELTHSEEMLASARRQLAAAVERARRAQREASNVGAANGAPAANGAVAAGGQPADEVDFAHRLDQPEEDAGATASAGKSDGWRVIDADTDRRERIAAALSEGLVSTPTANVRVVNLLSAISSGLDDVIDATCGRATVVGYAADDSGRSRILGGIRLFGEPPDSIQAVAAVVGPGRAAQRMILLSDDIDALIPAKAGLTKAGHSVSMACDAKQATDLLAMLTPDVVMVDLRKAPEAAAGFLAALSPESGRVLLVLVCGDPAPATLGRMLERLLRNEALDTADLVRACRCVLAGPPVPGLERQAPRAPLIFERLERPKAVRRATVLGKRLLSGRR